MNRMRADWPKGLEMAHSAAVPSKPSTILPWQATRCWCQYSSCFFSSAAEGTHQQLHCFLATHCDRAGDLLIPANGECPHGVACPPKHRLLPCQLLQHLYISKTQTDQGASWCCRRSRQLSSPAEVWPYCCCCCSARPQCNDISCMECHLSNLLACLLACLLAALCRQQALCPASSPRELCVLFAVALAFVAFCSLSPDSPTQQLRISFCTRISRMGLLTFFSACAHAGGRMFSMIGQGIAGAAMAADGSWHIMSS